MSLCNNGERPTSGTSPCFGSQKPNAADTQRPVQSKPSELQSVGHQVDPVVNRWHSFIRVIGHDATIDFTGVDITGHDGGLSRIILLQRGLALIQSQFRFASGRVRTMAGETMIGKNRPDVSVEYNLGRLRMEWPQRSQHYDECETDVP